jgi:gamma-glutamylcyclotransferase (GGCT)/AIG2-like uncharacterized protein YtfP
MTDDLLFVYGTLRRDTDSGIYQLLASYADFVTEGTCQGRLYKIDYYPGVVPSNNPEERVIGEVYRLRNSQVVLPKLDQYEECGPEFPEPTEYVRRHQEIELSDGTKSRAWVYLYNHPVDKLEWVPSGDFLAYETKSAKPHR